MSSIRLTDPGNSIEIEDKTYKIIEKLAEFDSIYYYQGETIDQYNNPSSLLIKLIPDNDRYFRECAILEKLREAKFILKPIIKAHSTHCNFLVYEYPLSFTLRTFLSSKKIEAKSLCLILLRVLIALHSIHKEQIFHLKIDENSIFVDENKNIFLGGFQDAVCLSDKNYSKQADRLSRSESLPPEFEKNPNKPNFKASTDVFMLGMMVKKIIQTICPHEDFEYLPNESEQFEFSEYFTGYYWKLICSRMTEKNPLLRADVIEIIGILSQFSFKIQNIINENFGSQLNVYFIKDFSLMCRCLIYENSDHFDFPFLHRMLLSLRLDQSLLSELSRLFQQSEYKSKPLVILKILAFLFYFYSSGVPYIFNPLIRMSKDWSNYSAFFNSITEACHSPELTTVNLHRELMIQMLQVLFFKEDLHTRTQSSGNWTVCKKIEGPVSFSYLKRLNELFDLLARSLKTIPVVASVLIFLCIDESSKALKFFENSIETNKTSTLVKDLEVIKKKSEQNLKTFHDLHQVKRQTLQSSFIFGPAVPKEFKKYEKSLKPSRYSMILPTDRSSPDLCKQLSPKKLKQGKLISSRPEHSIYEGIYKTHQVAIKVFHTSHPLSSTLFKNELKILKQLKHKNIVKLLMFDESQPNKLVYHFCAGGTLHESIHEKPDPTFSVYQKLHIGLKIAEAMQEVHSNGIIHRGLAVKNVLLVDGFRKIPSEVKIRLGGFGMAVFEDSSSQGLRSGDLYYRSPEMLAGDAISFSSDVYSFAFLLLELLTQQVPLAEETEIQMKVVQENFRPDLSGLEAEVQGINNIIRACWQQDPGARPKFSWVVEELQKLTSSFSI